MEQAQGTVSNCQHTLKVSGGANNTSTTTTYIALFRVNGQPVQFRSSSPSSISDGDQVAVAGLPWRGSLDALALRNLTTGEVMNAGMWSYIIGAVVLPVIGVFIGGVAGHLLGTLAFCGVALLITAITIYLVYRAELTSRAIKIVGG